MAYPCVRCGELIDSGEDICTRCDDEIAWEQEAEERKDEYDDDADRADGFR